MSRVRVLVGTRKGAFILSSDGKREKWDVSGPHFLAWEIYHVKGSPVDPNRIYASQSSGWFGNRCSTPATAARPGRPSAINSSSRERPERTSGATARRIRGSSIASGISNHH